MFLDFAWLPPEINSARIFAGAGSGPLHMAAAAWEGLARIWQSSASSFDSVIRGLAGWAVGGSGVGVDGGGGDAVCGVVECGCGAGAVGGGSGAGGGDGI